MTFRQVNDGAVDVGAGLAETYQIPVQMDLANGAAATLGLDVLVHIDVEFDAVLTIAYSLDGALGTYRDRGTVDLITPNCDLIMRVRAVGTHMQFTITDTSGLDNQIHFFATI